VLGDAEACWHTVAHGMERPVAQLPPCHGINSGNPPATLLGLPERALSDVSFAHMKYQPKRMDIEAAKEDLKIRSLAQMGNDFARILYLSSLRDFSTGEYHHHGLATSFSESAASGALTACHQELFYSLVMLPLESFVAQIDRFIRSTHKDYQSVLSAWENLQAYNTAVPSVCDQMAADLFRSNIRVTMAFLKSSSFQEGKSQSASPHRLPGQ